MKPYTILLAALLLPATFALPTSAQEGAGGDAATQSPEPADPIGTKLSAAKATYEAESAAWRAVVEGWFSGREDSARKDGDKQRVDLVKAERQAFVERGTLPKWLPTTLTRRRAAVRADLLAAYDEAVKAYTRDGKDDPASGVEAEKKAFVADDRRDPRATKSESPTSRARARLSAELADSQWRWGAGTLTLDADGTAIAQTPEGTHELTWAVVSGNQIVLRWLSGDFDIFTFDPAMRSYVKDYLGRPAGHARDRVAGERVK